MFIFYNIADFPLTFEEMKQLCLNMQKLTPPELNRIMRMIQSREPSLKDDNPDFLELDFGKLKSSTLRATDRFIKFHSAAFKGKAGREDHGKFE